MADLIAIGYPDETTAEQAAAEAQRLARDLIIEPDATAAIVRDEEGKFHVHTSHHPVGTGATWGMFWGPLFGVLFHTIITASTRKPPPGWAYLSWSRMISAAA